MPKLSFSIPLRQQAANGDSVHFVCCVSARPERKAVYVPYRLVGQTDGRGEINLFRTITNQNIRFVFVHPLAFPFMMTGA